MPQQAISLVEQAFGLRADGSVVVIQHWAGFTRGKHGFAKVVNGTVVAMRPGGKRAVDVAFFNAKGGISDCQITEQEARDKLAAAGYPDVSCEGCQAVLPVGGRWCAQCGEPGYAGVSGGAMAAVTAAHSEAP